MMAALMQLSSGKTFIIRGLIDISKYWTLRGLPGDNKRHLLHQTEIE